MLVRCLLFIILLGGCLTVFSWGNYVLAELPNPPQENAKESKHTNDENNKPAQLQPTPPAKNVKAPSIINGYEEHSPEYYSKNDLSAQQRMADATDVLVNLTERQIIITGIEAALLISTLFFTAIATKAASRAAKAADDAVEITERTNRQQLRAYVGVVRVEISWEPSEISVTVIMKNVGQTPARKMTAWHAWGAGENIIYDDAGEKSRAGPSRDIFPGVDLIIPFPINFASDDIKKAVWDGRSPLHIWGGIVYFDIFGTRCETRFRTFFDKKIEGRNTSYGLLACNEGNEST